MFQIDSNLDAFLRTLSNDAAVVMPSCIVMALNDTAYDNLRDVQREMSEVFDRPTRWTLNAFMVWRARPGNWSAQVKERTSMSSRHYLKVQASGGVRPQTALEKLIKSRLNYAGDLNIITPAAGAALDAHGNWSVGQRNQALSAIGAQRDARSNTTARSKARNAGKRATFFVPKPGSGLRPGIYARSPDGVMTKIVNFSPSSARYDKRFAFEDVNLTTARAEFPRHLKNRMAIALQSRP